MGFVKYFLMKVIKLSYSLLLLILSLYGFIKVKPTSVQKYHKSDLVKFPFVFSQVGCTPMEKVYSEFDHDASEWAISWPGRVSQYDLVYKSPPIDPMQGIPLGNGEVGALLWCEESKIIIAVNKSDLWDDASFGTFHNHSGKELDYSTTLRHGCRIIIDFKYPVFSFLYLSDFSGRLSLSDATLSIESSSPFGKIGFKGFVDPQSGALIYELSSDMNEDVPVDITLEHLGSRTFSDWYSHINRDASIGLPGTEAMAAYSGAYITQSLTSGTSAVGGRVVDDNGLKVGYIREHSRSTLIQLSGNRHKKASFIFIVTSPVAGDPVSSIKSRFPLEGKSIEETVRSHGETWKSVWHRSFMDYEDDYLNNLWYLTMYYLNASQGGKYPGRFFSLIIDNSQIQNIGYIK